MSTAGKVCLVITVLLLLMAFLPIPSPWGGWTPKLLILHNQWSEKFRDSKQKANDAQQSFHDAKLELAKATTDINSLTVGWGRFWVVPERAQASNPNAPQLNVMNNGGLQLVNLGADQGIQPRQFTDDDNSQKTMSPAIHAFASTQQGEIYMGEFIVTQANPSSATLAPVHLPNVQLMRQHVNARWRLRDLIPPADRLTVDELYQHYRRTTESTQRTNANITRQQELFTAAGAANKIRRGELLGNPEREEIQNRPEFTLGYLKVIEETEEDRNQLQLHVDEARRLINELISRKNELLETLNSRMTELPGGSSVYARVTSRDQDEN